jgi:hypothetical protein
MISDEKLNNDLLCCPFCGGKAIMTHDNFIHCENVVDCGAQIESGYSGKQTREFTITAWNRRQLDKG